MRNLFRLGAGALLVQMSLGLAGPVLAHHNDYDSDYDNYEYGEIKSSSGSSTGDKILYGVGGAVIGGVIGYVIGEREGVRKTERKYQHLINQGPAPRELPPQVHPQPAPMPAPMSRRPMDRGHEAHPPQVRVKVVPQQPLNREGCIQVKGDGMFCPVPAGHH